MSKGPAPSICDCTTECLYPERHPRRLPLDRYPTFTRYEAPESLVSDYVGLIVTIIIAIGSIVAMAYWAGS